MKIITTILLSLLISTYELFAATKIWERFLVPQGLAPISLSGAVALFLITRIFVGGEIAMLKLDENTELGVAIMSRIIFTSLVTGVMYMFS